MRDESFYKFMGVPHIGKNHNKIVLRGAQEIRTKDDRQCFRGHLILFFIICHPKKKHVKWIQISIRRDMYLSKCSDTLRSRLKLA